MAERSEETMLSRDSNTKMSTENPCDSNKSIKLTPQKFFFMINVLVRHIDVDECYLEMPHSFEERKTKGKSNFCNCVKASCHAVMFHFSSLTMKNLHHNVM